MSIIYTHGPPIQPNTNKWKAKTVDSDDLFFYRAIGECLTTHPNLNKQDILYIIPLIDSAINQLNNQPASQLTNPTNNTRTVTQTTTTTTTQSTPLNKKQEKCKYLAARLLNINKRTFVGFWSLTWNDSLDYAIKNRLNDEITRLISLPAEQRFPELFFNTSLSEQDKKTCQQTYNLELLSFLNTISQGVSSHYISPVIFTGPDLLAEPFPEIYAINQMYQPTLLLSSNKQNTKQSLKPNAITQPKDNTNLSDILSGLKIDDSQLSVYPVLYFKYYAETCENLKKQSLLPNNPDIINPVYSGIVKIQMSKDKKTSICHSHYFDILNLVNDLTLGSSFPSDFEKQLKSQYSLEVGLFRKYQELHYPEPVY